MDLTQKTPQLLLLWLFIQTLMANGPEGKLMLFPPTVCYVHILLRDLCPGVVPMEVFGSLRGTCFRKDCKQYISSCACPGVIEQKPTNQNKNRQPPEHLSLHWFSLITLPDSFWSDPARREFSGKILLIVRAAVGACSSLFDLVLFPHCRLR